MTVADSFVFALGFFLASLVGMIACRLVWVRAVRLTRARMERDRPETLRAFEARIAGAQARAAVSIRELERALERERQMSAQARLMADQMSSSSAIAMSERNETEASLLELSDTLNTTRERLREAEETLARRANELGDLRQDLNDNRQDLAMREDDVHRLSRENEDLRAELAASMAGDHDPALVEELAQTGGAAAMARAQIENLRDTVRQLRADKNAAEASAARARLLLEARDDNEAVAAAKADFQTERDALKARIAELETALHADHGLTVPLAPHLVAVTDEDRITADTGAKVPANANGQDRIAAHDGAMAADQLESLRASIDAMTASLTATAAIDKDREGRINALLDEAAEESKDSSLVTSLVEARERLRSRKQTGTAGSPASKAKAPARAKAKGTRAGQGKRATGTGAKTARTAAAAEPAKTTTAKKAATSGQRAKEAASDAKLSAATASGKPPAAISPKTMSSKTKKAERVEAGDAAPDAAAIAARKSGKGSGMGLPRASENDLKVV